MALQKCPHCQELPNFWGKICFKCGYDIEKKRLPDFVRVSSFPAAQPIAEVKIDPGAIRKEGEAVPYSAGGIIPFVIAPSLHDWYGPRRHAWLDFEGEDKDEDIIMWGEQVRRNWLSYYGSWLSKCALALIARNYPKIPRFVADRVAKLVVKE